MSKKMCPFCGMENTITEHYQNSSAVFCENCGATATGEYWSYRPLEDSLTAEVAALRARVAELEAEARWVSVEQELPDRANKKCEVRCKHNRSNKALVTVAVYVAPRSIRAEDFIDPDYSDSDWEDYEEETDTYWTPTGWYEDTIAEASDVNWFLSDDYEITHWRYIKPPEADNE